jgi:hypothetical protein
MSEKYKTNLQNVAALLHYLGLPMETVCNPKNMRCGFIFPMTMTKETCAGTVDYEVEGIIKRFHAGDCDVADANALINSVFHVLTQIARAKRKVGA